MPSIETSYASTPLWDQHHAPQHKASHFTSRPATPCRPGMPHAPPNGPPRTPANKLRLPDHPQGPRRLRPPQFTINLPHRRLSLSLPERAREELVTGLPTARHVIHPRRPCPIGRRDPQRRGRPPLTPTCPTAAAGLLQTPCTAPGAAAALRLAHARAASAATGPRPRIRNTARSRRGSRTSMARTEEQTS
ncbi:hypothetical protein DL768_005624 [Monosporascus sp. mg162]|nr:hypothetical protein DL768_005624 [Monosporascus sp. mg162]